MFNRIRLTLTKEYLHSTAEIASSAEISVSARVWQYAHIRENVVIKDECIIGRGVYIGAGVEIGYGCKIQNYALIYEPSIIEDGVFIGPAVVFTNDKFPRALNENGSIKSSQDWDPVGVHVKKGASIGANSTIIAPLVIGEYALIGSGSVVTGDVPNFALVIGNPAKKVRWVGKSGVPLEKTDEISLYKCPKTGTLYKETSINELVEVRQ